MIKRLLISTLILFSFYTTTLQAQGLLGGEIRWDCIPAGQANVGKFVFYLTVYQACYNDSGANPVLANTQLLESSAPSGNTTMALLPNYPKDVSPICNPDTNLNQTGCGTADSISAFNGAFRVYIYADTLQLNGFPPYNGWLFTWDGGTRNRSSNLVDSLNQTMRLRSIMYPFGTMNTYPCFDYAPTSAETPIVMTCNGYGFNYYPISTDKELDSLSYQWANPLDTTGVGVSFNANRSYLNPLPNASDDPNNIPVTVNPSTGALSITTYTQGGFFANHKITAYKCGVKVAEIYRDMYFQFFDCGSNVSPVFQPPFNNGTSFVDSIYAGQRASVNLNFVDSQMLNSTIPQSVKMMAYGLMFGNYLPATGGNPPIFDTTAGCVNPPCASLNAAPSSSLPLQDTTVVSTAFSWQTDCGHLGTNLGCGYTSNVFTFYFKYWDDYCPVPAYNFGHFSIVVLPKPTLPPPIMDSLTVDTINGDVTLHWTPVIDSLLAFGQYRIYASLNKFGQYMLLDSLYNLSDSTYTHQGAYGNNQQWFYYLEVLSGCIHHRSLSIPSDTLNTNPQVFNNIDLLLDTVFDPYYNTAKQVIVKVKNIGFPSVDSIAFRYMQPDSTWVFEQWKGYIAPGDSMNYTFNQVFIPAINPNYQLCVYADVVNDIDTTNNMNCAQALLGSVDISIEKVWNPLQTPTIRVYALIKNVGYPYIDSTWFSYYQPDSTLVKEFWAGNLASGDSVVYMFNQVFIPSYNPNYNLCVHADVPNDNNLSNNNKCIAIPLKAPTSQMEIFKLLAISPNPASETTQIRYILPYQAGVALQVFDFSGRLILQKQISSNNGINNYVLDVSSFESGVYFYRIQFEGESRNGKFVVMR